MILIHLRPRVGGVNYFHLPLSRWHTPHNDDCRLSTAATLLGLTDDTPEDRCDAVYPGGLLQAYEAWRIQQTKNGEVGRAWSGVRGSNPRHPAEAGTLPAELTPLADNRRLDCSTAPTPPVGTERRVRSQRMDVHANTLGNMRELPAYAAHDRGLTYPEYRLEYQ